MLNKYGISIGYHIIIIINISKLLMGSNFFLGTFWFITHLLIAILNDVCMKHLGANIAPAQVAFLRFFTSSLWLLPLFYFNKTDLKTQNIDIHLIRAALLVTGLLFWILNLQKSMLVQTTIAGFTIPLFNIVIARFILKEHLEVYKIIAITIGFAGILIAYGDASLLDFRLLLLCIAAFIFASLDIINKIYISKESVLSMMLYSNIFASIITTPSAFFYWAPLNINDIFIITLLGLGANILLFCLLKSLCYLEISVMAPFRFLDLILSAICGLLFFNEYPVIRTIIGGLFVISASVFIGYYESKKH